MRAISIASRSSLDAEVCVPGSKSCTARALIMAAFAKGHTVLLEPADCDDSDFMISGLSALGVSVAKSPGRIEMDGGDLRPPATPLSLGNSGTAVRFLLAACAALRGAAVIDGNERMRERPIGDLVDALRAWGIQAEAPTGCPPVYVRSSGEFGGSTSVKGGASSQYLTGLLLVAPKAARDASLCIQGELVSKPYVDLTLHMMAERGVIATHEAYGQFLVASGQEYKPGAYTIEADASSASYFFAAAAIAGGRIRVANLRTGSFQGDAKFPRVLEQMGCVVHEGPGWTEISMADRLRGIDIDLNDMPDMALTLAVTALFAVGPTTIRNVANLRIKETDRITALARELHKLGAHVEEFGDGLRIVPGRLHGAEIETYDDHRMAMSFAMAGLRVPGVVIRNPGCVSKTFPDFFDRFNQLG